MKLPRLASGASAAQVWWASQGWAEWVKLPRLASGASALRVGVLAGWVGAAADYQAVQPPSIITFWPVM